MMNLASYGVSATRIAALGGGAALSDEVDPSVSKRKEVAYYDIFRDRIERGEIVMTGDAAPCAGTKHDSGGTRPCWTGFNPPNGTPEIHLSSGGGRC